MALLKQFCDGFLFSLAGPLNVSPFHLNASLFLLPIEYGLTDSLEVDIASSRVDWFAAQQNFDPNSTCNASSEPIELTGREFEFLDGPLTFKVSQDYEVRRPYVIPHRFQDQIGKVIRTGAITVTQST